MKIRLIAFALILLCTLTVVQIVGTEGKAGVMASQLLFLAKMSGDQVVPPTDSSARGAAQFQMVADDEIQYRVKVAGIKNMDGASLHLGSRGSNGDLAVQLARFTPPDVGDNKSTQDVSFVGSISSSDLQVRGTVQDLYHAMAAGNAYISISTEQNPGGEIRGQLKSSIGIDG